MKAKNTPSNELHVILGAGAVGLALMDTIVASLV